ncbi:MAG: biopolymer transporter ExbB [Paracoccus sp. (in: a-proteobacteria)]|uniref:biopolymer transporter ExbB n=1 Tax=Paracoccus sp. TaxID=267 RepID=UPI0026DEED3A|nr:biopolymer transporter ExbB [Paracoccus sp. (in: a-proteobacteria)]MDO5631467.1 biopolymer transporter ExbB [Paracoccus sp. (in: a-proteobacteria)]
MTPMRPQFSQPVRQIVLMLIVLALVAVGGWFAYGRILPIFLANRWLNGLILSVFVLGLLACLWQVAQLVQSVSWIERFAARRRAASDKGTATRPDGSADQAPRLLAPLAALLGAGGPAGGAISTVAARSILESVATRIEESRDITRYLSNLLIFLGLLGTFYGLASTVPAIVETIRALAPQEGQTAMDLFDKLMGGLESQLGGMATAFSSSLLGLAGSLVVGLLDLFASHGQNRFYRELEEWMSGFTRISLAATEGEAPDQAEITGFLEQLGSQMERWAEFQIERDAIRDEGAAQADERVLLVAQGVDALARRSGSEAEAAIARAAALADTLNRLADAQDRLIAGQDRLAALQERLIAATESARPAPPDLSGVEAALHRLVIDLNDGREEMLSELRSDLLVLTRAVRAARFNDPFRDDLLPPGPHHRGGA